MSPRLSGAYCWEKNKNAPKMLKLGYFPRLVRNKGGNKCMDVKHTCKENDDQSSTRNTQDTKREYILQEHFETIWTRQQGTKRTKEEN